MLLKNNELSIASINCNGLLKAEKIHLIRHLRQQQPHIITLQETHIKTTEKEQTFHQYFGATQSFWTEHCGIVSLNADINLTQINTFNCPRHILTRVEHRHNPFLPFYILTIYAPAGTTTERQSFYSALCASPILDQQQPYRQRLIITGDFNYSYQRTDYHRNAPPEWFAMLQDEFFNCINPNPLDRPLPTFCRGDFTMSTIDYIFASPSFKNTVKAREVSYIANSWSDHALLLTTFKMGPPTSGKGYWRGNPLIGIQGVLSTTVAPTH
ncbi:Endonuclease/exonuclease/phosphatase [Fennellomyces sp. T-0311]|nr:Endonuclease/exonuclease/phosphatase [Fennellomyces sp. T-0311]